MKIIKDWWEKESKNYQKEFKIPTKSAHYGPGIPNEDKLNLLGNVKNKKILELGCGGGQCSIAFAKQGAKCIGIDISKNQLEFAKRLAKKEKVNVKFIKGNFQNLKKIKSNSQDIVFSAFAFQYSSNLNKLFREIRRVLKTNGLLVFSLDHPFYFCFNPKTLKIKKSYFKTGKLIDKDFMIFHRKISDIFNSLKKEGFDIEKILEPEAKSKNYWESEDYPKKFLEKIPATIIFKVKRGPLHHLTN